MGKLEKAGSWKLEPAGELEKFSKFVKFQELEII